MQCPACEENLSRAEYNGQQIVRCDSCNGSWLSGGAFNAVCSMDGAGFSPRDVAKLKILAQYKVEKTVKPTDHPCPRCSKKLKTRNFANIAGFFVEQCPGGCGVWVREGDLDRIRILRSLGVTEEVKVKRKPDATQQGAVQQPSPDPGAADPAAIAAAPARPAEPAVATPAHAAKIDASPRRSVQQETEKSAGLPSRKPAVRDSPAGSGAAVPGPDVAEAKPPAAKEKPQTRKTVRSPRVEVDGDEEQPMPGLFARIMAALFGRKKASR